MKCDAVKEMLWAYLENETTETAEIESHLAVCAACREELELQRELKNALEGLPDEELPEGYHAELMQKLQAEKKVVPFPAKKHYGWKQLGTIAAAVLVVVAAGGVKGMLEMRQNQNETMQQIMLDTTSMVDTTDTADTANMADTTDTADAGDGDTLYSIEGTPKTESVEDKAQTAPPKQAAPKTNSEEKKISRSAGGKAPVAKESPKAAAQADQAENAVEDRALLYGVPRLANVETADSLTLLAEDSAAALQAIRESIADCGGYEESTDDGSVQAVIPAINYQAFLEQIGKLGEVQALCQSAEDDAPRTIRISVAEK